jgi:hypothetical protein
MNLDCLTYKVNDVLSRPTSIWRLSNNRLNLDILSIKLMHTEDRKLKKPGNDKLENHYPAKVRIWWKHCKIRSRSSFHFWIRCWLNSLPPELSVGLFFTFWIRVLTYSSPSELRCWPILHLLNWVLTKSFSSQPAVKKQAYQSRFWPVWPEASVTLIDDAEWHAQHRSQWCVMFWSNVQLWGLTFSTSLLLICRSSEAVLSTIDIVSLWP